jgi:16S rRNA processing protein RimM
MTGEDRPVKVPDECVAIGVVRKPHGVHGQCAVSGFGDTLSRLSAPVKLWLGTDADAKTAREITVTEIRENPKGFICSFQGCDDMDSAGALRDRLLFCGVGSLPRLDKGTHYGFELEALIVVAEEDGATIGIVSAVEEYPSIACLVVRKDDGTTIEIAMAPGVVKAIDKENGTITVSRTSLEALLA